MLGVKGPEELIGRTAFAYIAPAFHQVVRERKAELTRDLTAPWLEKNG